MFFTWEISGVIFIGEGLALVRLQNDKTSKICVICPCHYDMLLKLVLEWRWLPHFPNKITFAHTQALLSTEKISESKALYC